MNFKENLVLFSLFYWRYVQNYSQYFVGQVIEKYLMQTAIFCLFFSLRNILNVYFQRI